MDGELRCVCVKNDSCVSLDWSWKPETGWGLSMFVLGTFLGKPCHHQFVVSQSWEDANRRLFKGVFKDFLVTRTAVFVFTWFGVLEYQALIVTRVAWL